MLAKKPVALNDKLVTAKIFWTSLYCMKIAVCVIFQAPHNLYIINNVNQIELFSVILSFHSILCEMLCFVSIWKPVVKSE